MHLVESVELVPHLRLGFFGSESGPGPLAANDAEPLGLGAICPMLLKKRFLPLGLCARELGSRGSACVAERGVVLLAHQRRVPLHEDLTADRAWGARRNLGRAM
jgi:hypothetical protein